MAFFMMHDQRRIIPMRVASNIFMGPRDKEAYCVTIRTSEGPDIIDCFKSNKAAVDYMLSLAKTLNAVQLPTPKDIPPSEK